MNSWYGLYKKLTKKLTINFAKKELEKAKESWGKSYENEEGIKKKETKLKLDYIKEIDEEKIKELANDYIFINRHFTYVPNESGGFSAFYWSNYNQNNDNYYTYLQIGDYTYKGKPRYRVMLRVGNLEGKNKKEKKEIRTYLYDKFTSNYPNYYVKPTRFYIGNSMAFVVLKGYENIKLDVLIKDERKRERLIKTVKRALEHMDKLAK